MKFDDLDKKMRVYETNNDIKTLPGIYMVARLDGRGFTRLTKELHDFEKPFDVRFKTYMVTTVTHLMQCGFNIVYGYTESDEISLLFHLGENAHGRKHRKYMSLLAGEASAVFSRELGSIGIFDCRISELPNEQLVVDYFRWRNEDAYRNSLNAHCYWQLRKTGLSPAEANAQLVTLSTAAKNELLFSHGINFNDLPLWQKRGIGFYWKAVSRETLNPKTGEMVSVQKRELQLAEELPMKEAYSEFVLQLVKESERVR